MKICIDGLVREMTDKEIAQMEADNKAVQAEYWQSVDYGEAINTEIRKKYTESEEFAILRQKEEKPNEYAEYFAYCEQCKAFVKEQKRIIFAEGQSANGFSEITQKEYENILMAEAGERPE